MTKKLNKKLVFTICLLAVSFFGAACGIVKNPFRDYSPKPFNAEEWRAGDAIERGRMVKNMSESIFTGGAGKGDVLKLLGEPDKKKTEPGGEIWFYRVDLGHNQAMPYLPITFHARMGTVIGRFRGDRVELLTNE